MLTIESERDMIGGQTEFVGWADEEHKKEIRRLREVIPRNAIKACELVKGKPMVLNDITDVTAFLCFGGQAIVKKEICEKYLPWFLDDFIVECNTLF